MDTKGCTSLAHIDRSFICIYIMFLDAYRIIMLCEEMMINVWDPLDELGTQKSKDWVCIHVANFSSCIHRVWDATVHDRNQLTPWWKFLEVMGFQHGFGTLVFIWMKTYQRWKEDLDLYRGGSGI